MAGNSKKINHSIDGAQALKKNHLILDINQIREEYLEANSTQASNESVTKDNVIPYIFVSFDLTNSTKLKHETKSWEKVITELFNSMPLVRTYLNFWKFNGDELLFFKEIKSLYQIAVIIDVVNSAMQKISSKLSIQKNQDSSGKNWYKVELKATIWLAGIDFENNFRINPPYGYDFIGTEIDEGFRLTKLATSGKCIIDPKIALLLAGFNAANSDSILLGELHKYFEIFGDEFKAISTNLKKNKIAKSNTNKSEKDNGSKYQLYYNLPHALFARNFIVFSNSVFEGLSNGLKAEFDKADIKIKSTIKECVDRMKLVGYSKCKGVWDEKEYPIIWYSKNWTRLDKEVAYNEKIGNDEVNKERLNKYYKDVDEDGYGIVTYLLLENIYRNIPSFSNSLNRILQSAHLKLISEPAMFRYSLQYTNTYYIVVCYLEETDSVLMFLRSPDRGHLANVWDFCCQKYLTGMDEDNGDSIFKSCIKKRYGIQVDIEQGYRSTSFRPFALKPIYRNGYFNQGVICFAKIDTSSYISKDNIEEQLLFDIKETIKSDLSVDEYPYYTDAMFIKRDCINVNEDRVEISFEDIECRQLTYSEELTDSKNKNDKAYNRFSEKIIMCSDAKEILDSIFNHFNKAGT